VIQRGILGQFIGASDVLYGLSTPVPQTQTDFDFVLRYWRQQGIFHRMHHQEEVFIPWRVFIFKQVTS
jgi:uncharacterized protein involved in type VI secretion and phage assembly